MKFPHLVALLTILLLTAGCANQFVGPVQYTKLRVTDNHGDMIAEWVARGEFHRVEKGYRITAVERLSGPRYPIYSRYPEGWRTTATGPHILIWPCGEPYWLYALKQAQLADLAQAK